MLRLFIAVEIPAAERAAAAALFTGLAGAKWAKPDQLHITLRFLGATAEERLAEIHHRLRAVKAPPFQLALQGVGAFPERGRRPRVLWLGVVPEAPLRSLKLAIDDALAGFAIAQARDAQAEFNPHLTLARLSGKPAPDLASFMARHAAFRGKPWDVTSFRLFKSTLSSAGAMHETLEVYPLA